MNFQQQNGYSPLENIGNLCYMNSCIQVLRSIPLLNSLFIHLEKHSEIIKTIPEMHVLREFNELQKKMNSQNSIIKPNRFVHFVKEVAIQTNNPSFASSEQNDITEFLLFLIECFHKSISRKIEPVVRGTPQNKTDNRAIACYTMLKEVYEKDYSELIDVFYGVLVSEILSIDGNILYSVKPEQFCILDLELPINETQTTLKNCFDEFTCHEIVGGENAWLNEKTGIKQEIQKRIQFWSLPNVLIISLKRFSFDGKKNNCLVDFPLENLDLSEYVCGYHASRSVYSLFGVCYHYGNVGGGHYTAVVRHNSQLKNGGLNKWIHYNDSIMQEVGANVIANANAYCLFYCRIPL